MPPTSPAWPLADLRLRTPRLELRPDDDAGLAELAGRAREGVHDPATMPFLVPWTDSSATEGFARGILQYFWGLRAGLCPESWSIAFLVRHEERVIGMQELAATDFAVLREVRTGSWLGRASQAQGLGTEMRAAVLRFAFDHLDARTARSAAFDDNVASRRVAERLGYRTDGSETHLRRGEPAVLRRSLLRREDFLAPPWPLGVDGVAGVRALLGLGGGTVPGGADGSP